LPVVATENQLLGQRGEKAVCSHIVCPQCGRSKQLRTLPPNFECVDVICKFCGFLAQVKATSVAGTFDALPSSVLGGAWGPQHQRIIAGIFHPLYVATFTGLVLRRIDYVPAHMLSAYPSVFKPRKKLSTSAKRSGWQGFSYDLRELPPIATVQLYPELG
jgi:type II restriction enzyme